MTESHQKLNSNIVDFRRGLPFTVNTKIGVIKLSVPLYCIIVIIFVIVVTIVIVVIIDQQR